MNKPWTIERKLKLIANGGGNGLGIDWWRQTAREALAEIEALKHDMEKAISNHVADLNDDIHR